MPDGQFVDPDTWFSGLPGVVVAAGGAVTDRDGRILLVKPNYRNHWTVPGGICEYRESPQEGAARELAEELGLPLAVGRLLVVDWSLQYGDQHRPIMHFVFDAGTLADASGITLQRAELDDIRFTAEAELPSYLPPHVLTRVTGALRALRTGETLFLPHQPG